MKRFFLMVLLASVFFTGLGGILRETTAKFKSDDKALALLAKARQAIGGEGSIAAVNSLIVTGRSTRTFKLDGADRTDQGEMELALQFPDKMMKMIKMGHDDGAGASGEKTGGKQVDVMIVRTGDGNAEWKAIEGDDLKPGEGKKIVIKKDDGTVEEIQPGKDTKFTIRKVEGSGDGQAEIQAGGEKQMVFKRTAEGHPGEFPWQVSGLARTALSLLLTAPQGMDISYLYGGEESVDGTACNVINAQLKGTVIKLYLGRDSNLPVMMSYQDAKPMMFRIKAGEGEMPAGGDKQVKVFTRQIDHPEMAEFQVRFSDYRSVNGVLLPYKWTQTMGGQPDEIVDVTSYEINPPNIADKFKAAGNTRTFVRRAKESSN